MAATKLRSVTATTSYVALEDIPCSFVSILNKTGAALLVEIASDSGSGKEVSLADGLSIGIEVISNAKEIRIKSASGTTGVYLSIQ
jgi:hypothetical protein